MAPVTIQTVVLASGNTGKVAELTNMLSQLQINVVAQTDLAVPEIPETGCTFIENAIIKARNAAKHTGLPALADDSGLEVFALNGAPGIYSARYAGEQATDADNCRKLLGELSAFSQEERAARFRCVLVFMRHAHDPAPLICQGIWEGYILSAPQGQGGFGYDPLFYVPTHQCSSAELMPEVKNQISHRARALQQLIQQLASHNRYSS